MAARQQVIVPEGFAIVEPGLYRCCGVTQSIHFPFVRSLQLKTFAYLSPDRPANAFVRFLQEIGVEFVHLGMKNWQVSDDGRMFTELLMKDALELVLDGTKYPCMVACSSGVQQTGVLVGCLRRLENWDLASVIEEYRRSAGTKRLQQAEQFVEMFDLDLVTMPSFVPTWLRELRAAEDDDERDYVSVTGFAAVGGDAPAYQRCYYDLTAPPLSPAAAAFVREHRKK